MSKPTARGGTQSDRNQMDFSAKIRGRGLWVDRLLLVTLVPVFLVCLGLHVREVRRTGMAAPPVFASPPPNAQEYPTVGGLRPERGASWNDLQVGDRLIQVGDSDLRGAGYMGFEAITMEEAGTSLAALLVYERNGERRTTTLRLLQYERPWHRIPVILALAISCMIVLLRSPGQPQARLYFATFMTLAILFSDFLGGPRIQSYADQIRFNLGWTIVYFLMIRWMIQFPDRLPPEQRISDRWAYIALIHLAVRLNYIFGVPLASTRILSAAMAVDAILVAALGGILVRNYLRSDPIGRRQMKWFVYGGLLGSSVLGLITGLGAVGLGVPGFEFAEMIEIAFFVGVLAPVGLLIAIMRANLFDIDRLISATATYTAAGVALLALTLLALPPLSEPMASWLGIEQAMAQVLVLVGLATLGLPFAERVRILIDRVFFPDRLARERTAEQLMEDLGVCKSEDDVLQLVAEGFGLVFSPRGRWVFRNDGGQFRAADASVVFDSKGSLAVALARQPMPRLVESSAFRSERGRLDPEDRTRLEDLEVAMIVPLRAGKDLAAFAVLGNPSSGDIYTATDVSLARAVAERASAELLGLRDARILEEERRRVEELRALREAAEEANLAKSRFLAAASHDLRQPLHALGLLVDNLSNRTFASKEQDIVRRIQESTTSLSEMFDALLDMSRLDAGRVDPEIRSFPVDSLMRQLAEEAGEAATRKGLEMHWTPCDAVVKSDPVLLRRILGNLLANALRYTREGAIRIEALRDGHNLKISVADTGPGIPQRQQAEIFNEFVRFDMEEGDRGLGLGLSIVQRLCRMLDHKIELDSKPGRGSTFTVTLPESVDASDENRQPQVVLSAGADLEGALVVVVDDDLAVLQAMRDLLESWGARVVAAASTQDALEGLERWDRDPALILVDYRLGGEITGLHALAALREKVDAKVPAIMVTGETDPETLREIREHGLSHLSKPVLPFKLRAVILEALRS